VPAVKVLKERGFIRHRRTLKSDLAKDAVFNIEKIRDLPLDRARDLQAFLRAKGFTKNLKTLSDEALALVQNLQQARVGLRPSYAISRPEQARLLKEVRCFLRALQEAKRRKLF